MSAKGIEALATAVRVAAARLEHFAERGDIALANAEAKALQRLSYSLFNATRTQG